MNDNTLLKYALNAFLEEAHELLKENKLHLVNRDKNTETMLNLGLTPTDVEDILIENLSVRNYYRGPEEDYDPDKSGNIWKFGIEYDGEELYVKLTIDENLVCISFHTAKFNIDYPFRT